MGLVFEDWRDADAVTIEALYAAERARWQEDLAWDSGLAWATVEAGRQRGTVCGWILRDGAGRVHGWTYYLLFEGELQIGALTAERAVDIRDLLDHVIDSPEASLASTISCFVYPAQPSLLSALRRRRFSVRQSRYLTRTITEADSAPSVVTPPAVRLRSYRAADLFPAVRLMSGAYEGSSGAVCFAPHGRLDEWVKYTRQLIEAQPCGRFLPDASFAAEDADSGRLLGLVLTTAVSPGVAHIAQLVVDHRSARRGVGRTLLSRAFGVAQATGHSAVTLMVDEGNVAAGALYASLGFTQTSAFVSARRPGQVRTYVSPARTADSRVARRIAV